MTSPSAGKPEATLSPQTAATSPLAEADAQSLEVLFSRDPFEMIAEDEKGAKNFPTIVAALRRQREAWRKAEAAGATRAAQPKKAKVTTSLAELGLDD